MTGLLLAIAWQAVVNAPRTRLGVPEGSDHRARFAIVATGGVLALGAFWLLAGVSGPLLEALEITPETFRIAAGLVVVVGGVRSFVKEIPHEEPVPEGPIAALWPVAFPRLITPSAFLLAISAGSTEGVVATMVAVVAAVAILVALFPVRTDGLAGRVLVAVGRIVAVLAVVAGIFLMVDGIRDV
ncbi:hypothetical protein HQ535_03575 [bacterium]|nr:hypothetical protein [bacterium]